MKKFENVFIGVSVHMLFRVDANSSVFFSVALDVCGEFVAGLVE
jgi:hypothetical protein